MAQREDITPEQAADLRAAKEERRRAEREVVYSPREVLGFLSNSLLSLTHRQGFKPIPPERLQVLTRCAGVLVKEMRELVNERALRAEEMEIIWVAAAMYVECIVIQKRKNMPFGNFDIRG